MGTNIFANNDSALDSHDPNDPYSALSRDAVTDNVLGSESSGEEPTTMKHGEYEGQGLISSEYYKNEKNEIISTPNKYRWVWKNSQWIKQDIVITSKQIKNIFENALEVHIKNLETQINLNYSKFLLNNFNIISHFLGQIAHETGGLKNNATIESGYYKTVERVGEVFGTGSSIYQKTKSNPDYYLKNTEHFLNMSYANKGGNGNESSGDGYKYRGRGYIQLTLKDNYSAFDSFYKSNYDSNADFLANPDPIGKDNNIAIISALHYFMVHTIATINNSKTQGDKITNAEFKAITVTINAKAVALQERLKYYKKAYNELTKPI